MVTLTRKTDYALVALAHLARRGSELASAREIADRVRIPLPVLMNVLNKLAHCRLVDSTRGVKGGYRLARAADRITLAELIDAVEGPLRLTACCRSPEEDADGECDLEPVCEVKQPMQAVHRRLEEFLSRVTLADIAWDTVPLQLSLVRTASADSSPVAPAAGVALS